eukprot:CAMPEP_0174914380 /NCGR_PEP_ID=MMETSP0167-20121228/80808_1 /TAXON_ID=38298 /ORGANISM="Rhodella maculata, Strain CCMP736" /LENGTH=139 /DNA_ID=CAMNT_0016159133 /DNA_START=425 /DNA_END=841 /DNA_ORIENTATION=+
MRLWDLGPKFNPLHKHRVDPGVTSPADGQSSTSAWDLGPKFNPLHKHRVDPGVTSPAVDKAQRRQNTPRFAEGRKRGNGTPVDSRRRQTSRDGTQKTGSRPCKATCAPNEPENGPRRRASNDFTPTPPSLWHPSPTISS